VTFPRPRPQTDRVIEEKREMAHRLLLSVADELERSIRTEGHCNTLLARYAGGAALLLGFDDIAPRFVALLEQSNWDGFFGDVLTNIDLPTEVPDKMRRLRPLQAFDAEHPVFATDDVHRAIRRYAPALTDCLVSGFAAAITATNDEFRLEQIALAQAVLGHDEGAVETSLRLRDPRRLDDVRFVMAIERFRRGQFEEGREALAPLSVEDLTSWTAAYFAMGICDRTPWVGYPFPDD